MRAAGLLLWCILLFGYGITGPLYRTESLRAKIAQETLAGNWLVPTLYGQPFVTKPPGTYVAIALCSWPSGEVSEVTARLPSTLFATLTVFLIFAHLRQLMSVDHAWWISLFVPVSFLWLEKSPSAEIDMLQLGWVTWSLLAFHQAMLTHAARWWFLALLCVAGGLLTKWTAPAFFYLTIIPYLLYYRQIGVLFRWPHLLAVFVASSIVGLWAYLAMEQIGWQTLQETIGNEAAQRFAPSRRGKPYPWLESLTFPFIFLAANGLATVGTLATLTRSFRHQASTGVWSFVVLAQCWIWPNLLFWSLPAQHNVRYLLPVAPALTLLGGLFWVCWALRQSQTMRNTMLVLPLIAWCGVKIAFVEIIQPQRVADRNARETGTRLAKIIPNGEHLTIDKLKDEGILFYYGNTVVQKPWTQHPQPQTWALLMETEWKQVESTGMARLVEMLQDQQGANIYLVYAH